MMANNRTEPDQDDATVTPMSANNVCQNHSEKPGLVSEKLDKKS